MRPRLLLNPVDRRDQFRSDIRGGVRHDHDAQSVPLAPKHVRTVRDVWMRGRQECAVKRFLRYAFGYHSGLGVTRDGDIPEAKDAPIKVFADFFWFGGHAAVSCLLNVRLAASKMNGMPSDHV